MKVADLILFQPIPDVKHTAVYEIQKLGEGDTIWMINLAISYGIILGKRELRKKKAKA